MNFNMRWAGVRTRLSWARRRDANNVFTHEYIIEEYGWDEKIKPKTEKELIVAESIAAEIRADIKKMYPKSIVRMQPRRWTLDDGTEISATKCAQQLETCSATAWRILNTLAEENNGIVPSDAISTPKAWKDYKNFQHELNLKRYKDRETGRYFTANDVRKRWPQVPIKRIIQSLYELRRKNRISLANIDDDICGYLCRQERKKQEYWEAKKADTEKKPATEGIERALHWLKSLEKNQQVKAEQLSQLLCVPVARIPELVGKKWWRDDVFVAISNLKNI